MKFLQASSRVPIRFKEGSYNVLSSLKALGGFLQGSYKVPQRFREGCYEVPIRFQEGS